MLQQPIDLDQFRKLLTTGKTDLLDKFVSMRTRRSFKAYLAWDPEAGKVSFAFEPRNSKYPPRKTSAQRVTAGGAQAKTTGKSPKGAKSKAPTKTVKAKTPRKVSAPGSAPSQALAAVIGPEAVPRTEVIKKLWDYIKANNLQDPDNKRNILADGKLREVFGKDSVTMFELAGIVGKHLIPIA